MKLKWEDLILRPINLWSLPMGFIRHHPCPKCGSKDNLGEYETNFYCFGCGYYKPKEDLNSVRARREKSAVQDNEGVDLEVDYTIPPEGMRWLLQYGITSQDAELYKLGWNHEAQMLVLVNMPDYYQGRNFSGKGPKYLSRGRKPLLFYGSGDTIVCVEDVVSAIKIAKAGHTGVPLLGSSISQDLQEALISRRSPVILWLDRDKAKEAVLASRNLYSKGVDCSVRITPKDPKEYSIGEIDEWLKNR